jgi:hypothetical protein
MHIYSTFPTTINETKFNGLSPLSPNYGLELKFIFAKSLRNNYVLKLTQQQNTLISTITGKTPVSHNTFLTLILFVLHVSAKAYSYHQTKDKKLLKCICVYCCCTCCYMCVLLLYLLLYVCIVVVLVVICVYCCTCSMCVFLLYLLFYVCTVVVLVVICVYCCNTCCTMRVLLVLI